MVAPDALRVGAAGLEVFVVRQGNKYQWQLRRFGAVVVEIAPEVFVEQEAARAAGEASLAARVLSGRPCPPP